MNHRVGEGTMILGAMRRSLSARAKMGAVWVRGLGLYGKKNGTEQMCYELNVSGP